MRDYDMTTSRFLSLSKIGAGLLWLAAAAGLTLSFVDLFGICTDACSETAQYTIFGIGFGWFGLAFFLSLLVILAVRSRFPRIELLLVLFFFSAAGAELYFIWLQKYVIEAWCPICLAIAASVFLGCAVVVSGIVRSRTMRKKFKVIAVMLVALTVGAVSAVFGVTKESHAALNLYLGKIKSPVTVYFISDWFCPACRVVEPRIEQIYNHVVRDNRVAFIDYPVHTETNNFTPYNLQFLAFEKKKYIKLRTALAELANKTRTPTPEQVQAAVAPHGVKLRQVDYADILYGLQFNLTTYRGFGVDGTPAVVVVRSGGGKPKVLVGAKQITLKAVQAAVAETAR